MCVCICICLCELCVCVCACDLCSCLYASLHGQYSKRTRVWHRRLGNVYYFGVLCGVAGGLVLATRTQGGWISVVGFSMLAMLWLITALVAVYFIKYKRYHAVTENEMKRCIAKHRAWMLRNMALTFASVTLRLYWKPLFKGVYGKSRAWDVSSWMCWIGNGCVIEGYLLYERFCVLKRSAYY